jgi:hypothetical protein
MFAEFHRRAFALRHYIRFERAHLWIIRVEFLAARRLFAASDSSDATRMKPPSLFDR